ncbi:MAG: hypothetical protein GYB31_00360 [Bacteroidetes bacterium]|nr:hypothetical protein [Bacteroidota bacterium]
MPSSIPFVHPSLVLGNIVDSQLLKVLQNIEQQQAKVDAAQDKMNSFLQMKRSLSMTLNELAGMGVDVSTLTKKITEIDKKLVKAANNYITVKLTIEEGIQKLRESITKLDLQSYQESPVDFTRTEISRLPLGSDSIKFDAQYFSYGSNLEANPNETTAKIEDYIRESTSDLGAKPSGNLAKTVGKQVNVQRQKHSLAGTLILTATCTHKNTLMLSPLVVDAEKAIEAWNQAYPGNVINGNDAESMKKLESSGAETKESLTLISGVNMGSSFIGMVHILNTESLMQNMAVTEGLAEKLQERFTIGGWIEESSGGIGVDPDVAAEVRNILSAQNISSHVTMVSLGAIPSIKSNAISLGLRTLNGADNENLSKEFTTIQQLNRSDHKTVRSSAEAAKNGNRIMTINGARIKNVLEGLGRIDQKANQAMDINSLMIAFQDYLEEVKKGKSGVPIHFYLKRLTKRNIARLWKEKYFPDEPITSNAHPAEAKPNGKHKK